MNYPLQSGRLATFMHAVSALAGMALLFLLVSWAIGGDRYFKDVLIGEITLPVLIVLILPGIFSAAGKCLREKSAKSPGTEAMES